MSATDARSITRPTPRTKVRRFRNSRVDAPPDSSFVIRHSSFPLPVHPAEGATAVEAKRPLFPSLAMLLAGHVIRDGEVVLLILKPSLWFVLFQSMRFGAGIAILIIAGLLWVDHPFLPYYVEAGVFLIAGRVMWAALQWMGRFYVLTDMRVLRLSGVFTVDIFDCPLRQVAQTRLTRSFRERLWRLGSIEVLPRDETRPPGTWNTVRRPREVQEEVEAAIRKARSGGGEWT